MHNNKTAVPRPFKITIIIPAAAQNYKAICPPRTVTVTLDVFPTPFPIKEAQAVAAALLAYEIAQMKRVTFTTGGGK